jgi:hypothetical protein
MVWSYEVFLKPTNVKKAIKKLKRVKGVEECFELNRNVIVRLNDDERSIEDTVRAIKNLPYVDKVGNL